MWYQNIGSAFYSFVTKHLCDRQTERQTDGQTDRRTNRQNYNSQDHASIVASRGKNRHERIISVFFDLQ